MHINYDYYFIHTLTTIQEVRAIIEVTLHCHNRDH